MFLSMLLQFIVERHRLDISFAMGGSAIVWSLLIGIVFGGSLCTVMVSKLR